MNLTAKDSVHKQTDPENALKVCAISLNFVLVRVGVNQTEEKDIFRNAASN